MFKNILLSLLQEMEQIEGVRELEKMVGFKQGRWGEGGNHA